MLQKPLNGYLAHLLTQANRRLKQQLIETGVSLDQWRLLVTLQNAGGATMGELAESLAVNQPTLTRTVDKMVEDALMYRVSDPDDRRKVRIFLSEKGKVLLDRQNALVEGHEAKMEGFYGNEDAQRLKTLLESLIKQIS